MPKTEHCYLPITANNGSDTIIYKSNSRGFIIEKAVYNRNGDLKDKETYVNDDHGRVIELRTLRNQQEVKEVTRYDSNGNPISVVVYMSGGEIASINRKYDSRGNIVESDTYSLGLRKRNNYKYVFDKNGNFISKTVTTSASFNGIINDPQVTEIVERTIKYELTDEERRILKAEQEKQLLVEERRRKEQLLADEEKRIEEEKIRNEELEKEKIRQEQERIKKEEIDKEQKRVEEEKIRAFLKIRKDKVYNLEDFSKHDYAKVREELENMVGSSIAKLDVQNFEMNGYLSLEIDTLGKVTFNSSNLVSKNKEVLNFDNQLVFQN